MNLSVRSSLAIFFIAVSCPVSRAQFPSFRLLNTPYDELNPVISPDGSRLYFTRANHPDNIGGKADPGDIWVSININGEWSAAVHAGSDINDRAYNAVLGFSADGMQMFLNGHYTGSASAARTQGISVSRWTGHGWSKPENIFIPFYLNKSNLQGGYITPDGQVLVFAAEAYGSYGVEDIFFALKQPDGSWSEPRNAGPVVNTRFQELSPSLSTDKTRLYFATNGRGGFGSFDIFYCERLDDTFTRWSEPVNLGAPVNTEGRELFYRFVPAGGAVFTTTKDSNGYGDIRYYDGPLNPAVRPDTIVAFKTNVYPELSGQIRIYGWVADARTGKPIRAEILFKSGSQSWNTECDALKGYQISLPSSGVFDIEVRAVKYIAAYEQLDLQTREVKNLELNFRLQPVEVGTTVTLKNVLFKQGTPELLSESYAELDRVVEFLKANPQVEIELAGHTDNRGSYQALMDLSQKRVNVVKSYLVSKGIEARRITGRGYGGTRPVASNDTEETRQLNRRVEFIIKKT
ncbi:MAG: OmpA family protein [Cyclobacteriaceae bacterium]|nr:OmpA family protein [Cyclobacteriaceae bacterium]